MSILAQFALLISSIHCSTVFPEALAQKWMPRNWLWPNSFVFGLPHFLQTYCSQGLIVPVYRKHDKAFNLYVIIINIQLHINNQLPLAQCPLVYLKQLYLCPGRDGSTVLDDVPDHVVVMEDGSPSVDPETSDGLTSRVDVAESEANGCDKTADIVENPWKREQVISKEFQ